MKAISATRLKQRFLEILDQLDGEGIVITRCGKPVARVLPVESDYCALLGSLKGRIAIHGEIMSIGEEWGIPR